MAGDHIGIAHQAFVSTVSIDRYLDVFLRNTFMGGEMQFNGFLRNRQNEILLTANRSTKLLNPVQKNWD